MASKRKGKEAATTDTDEVTSAPAVAVTKRVTRSTTRKLNNPDSVSSAKTQLPPPKKKKATPRKQKTTAPSAEEEKRREEVKEESDECGVVVDENEVPAVVPGEQIKEEGVADVVEQQTEEEDADMAAKQNRTLVIEHCKQCNSFKTRAVQVKNGVEGGVPGITVLVNPEKPRRGCFEIREEGGETFISLLDMKRPFTPMKELDMGKVISDIIEKIK